jgi:glycosyltransferase involved in cell wall biosynthesis
LRLLIGGSPSKIFHLNDFAESLSKLDVDTKVVIDNEYCDGFPSRNISKWFQTKTQFNKLLKEFKPDLIIVDRPRHFARESVNQEIPTLVHLRGDFWSEIKWAKETTYKKFPKNIVIKKWEDIGNQVFENAKCILPICKYLEGKIHDKFPQKMNYVLYQGISSKNWFHEDGINLKHPCVGLVQSANIWGKTQEMLILKNVLKKFPNIMFYWVGDGPYAKIINSELSKYENFKWLGGLTYPNEIRKFLSEIDIYALISGIDMAPLTLLEAQLMKKPIIATSVGGIPELMDDGKTGFLVNKNDESDIIQKISILLNDQTDEFGERGREFVSENFSWEKISKDFMKFINREFI